MLYKQNSYCVHITDRQYTNIILEMVDMRFSINTFFRSKGRNGFDRLGIFTWCVSIAFFIATIPSHNFIVYLIAVGFLAWSVFRMMSKNIDRRYLEEQRFLKIFYNIKYFITDTKNWFTTKKFASTQKKDARVARKFEAEKQKQAEVQRKAQMKADEKIYKYFECPNCSQKIRVPKGHGKIEITCPKCGEKFIKRT